jgi:hypothetical protein
MLLVRNTLTRQRAQQKGPSAITPVGEVIHEAVSNLPTGDQYT